MLQFVMDQLQAEEKLYETISVGTHNIKDLLLRATGDAKLADSVESKMLLQEMSHKGTPKLKQG